MRSFALEPFSPDRLLIVAAFLAVLLAVWLVVRLNRGGLGSKLTASQPIDIEAARKLGPDGQAFVLRVDGERLLVVTQRRTGIAVHALGPRPAQMAEDAVS